MADNDSKAPLLEQSEHASHSHDHHEKSDKNDIIVPILLIIVTGTGLLITGFEYALDVFGFGNFAYGLLILVILLATSWVNNQVVAGAAHQHKIYSYSKLIPKYWGRKRGLTVQSLMVVHSVIIITYLQERIAYNAYKITHAEPNQYSYVDAFYYIAIANIPLILLALQNEFSRIRWFAVIGILVWIYMFIGVIAEAFPPSETFFKTGDKVFPAPDLWMLTYIGVLAYFTSSFQIIPYIHSQVPNPKSMKDVLNAGVIGTGIIAFSVLLYYIFSSQADLDWLRYTGLVIIGISVTIINVLPTRELVVQILDENAKDKQKTRDRFITLCILTFSLLFSLFLVHANTWKAVVGLGTIFTSILGYVVPAILNLNIEKENKRLEDKKTKLKVFLWLAWNFVLAGVIFVSGIFMFIVDPSSN